MLMKSSGYSPHLLLKNLLHEFSSIFKGKSLTSPFYGFSEFWNPSVNKEIHTMTSQSNFTLTPRTSMQLS